MQLTYDKGYADYTDTAHWLPRLEQLKAAAGALTPDSAASMPDAQLLDAMEQLEELMRFYCSEQDFQGLEPAMRKFNDLLKLCRSRMISGVEVSYLEMVFLRLNALLYRGHGQNRQAAEGYQKCLDIAKRCFSQLRASSHLNTEQILFVGWNCVECFRETAETNDAILNADASVETLRAMIPMLKWLETYILTAPGLCDQAAEQYTTIAGILYQHQDMVTAGRCYESAIELLNGLDTRIGSDFYRARAIWVHCNYGLMEFMQRGNPNVMIACEKEADEYLLERQFAEKRDTAIVQGAKGMVLIQKGLAFQQNGNLPQAISLAGEGCNMLKETLEVLENDYKPHRDYYRTVVFRIAARVYNSYVGALDGLGVMYYQNEDSDLAEQTFSTALDLLTDSDTYSMGESGSALIRAEANQYMSLISSDKGDVFQADFYGTQAADLAMELGEQTGNAGAWDIAMVSCCLVAEICLAMKNKPKALTYADKGLLACDNLAQLMPQNPKLQLRDNLIKFRKKASRRFF